jgi:hypothetical protein
VLLSEPPYLQEEPQPQEPQPQEQQPAQPAWVLLELLFRLRVPPREPQV